MSMTSSSIPVNASSRPVFHYFQFSSSDFGMPETLMFDTFRKLRDIHKVTARIKLYDEVDVCNRFSTHFLVSLIQQQRWLSNSKILLYMCSETVQFLQMKNFPSWSSEIDVRLLLTFRNKKRKINFYYLCTKTHGWMFCSSVHIM